jgi:ribosomal protein S18 acetylase RimI-like enzyme
LLEKGYKRKGAQEHQHRVSLNAQFKSAAVKKGYVIRSLGDVDEIPARSWLSWRAFHPDETDEAYEGWEWYLNLQKAPLYRRDLDLVAVSRDGELSSFCTFWYDDVTRTAYVEPVGTHPEHQKRGLGKAIISEGLHRVKKLGGVVAYIGGNSNAANSLYSWFTDEQDLREPWQKEGPKP